jgi:G:T/U-mismatch repair DNA glycosylase
MRIEHKFRDHEVSPDTVFLFVGTFNPDVEGNGATFFYGREANDLWDLLPTTFNEDSLKNASLGSKKDFMRRHGVDFVDMISALEGVPEHEAMNYADAYIDGKVIACTDVVRLIGGLRAVRAVYLTRKTYDDKVPNIRSMAKAIKSHCSERNIRCAGLITPSRMYRNMTHKRDQWRRTLVTQESTEFTGI